MCAEKPSGQSPKMSLSTSCQVLSKNQASTWDPRHPQPRPLVAKDGQLLFVLPPQEKLCLTAEAALPEKPQVTP